MAKTSTADTIVIRRATPADLPVIGRLGALLVREHHEFDPKRFIPATPHTEGGYASFIGTQLDVARVVVLVAVQGETVVGYTYAGIEEIDWMSLRGRAGALYDIVVDPDHRQHGAGRKLLDATLEALEALGMSQVVLSTAQQNEAAQRLFERAGFRRTMIEMTRDQPDGS